MGKKTLEEIIKIILISAISISFTIMGTKRAILDSKLSKEDYEEDQSKRWNSHKEIHAKDDKRMDEMHEWVKAIYMKEIGSKK